MNSGNKASLEKSTSTTASEGDWSNWVKLHDKTDGGAKDIVDIGKSINLLFKGDTSNMFQVLSRPSNSLWRGNDARDISLIGVEGELPNAHVGSTGC